MEQTTLGYILSSLKMAFLWWPVDDPKENETPDVEKQKSEHLVKPDPTETDKYVIRKKLKYVSKMLDLEGWNEWAWSKKAVVKTIECDAVDNRFKILITTSEANICLVKADVMKICTMYTRTYMDREDVEWAQKYPLLFDKDFKWSTSF